MRKIILAAIALATLLPLALNAQSDASLKALKKEYNAKRKEFKKAGWKLYGSSKTLDAALLNHYKKLEEMGDNAEEIIGNVGNCNSMDIGHQLAINNATTKYAQKCSSSLRGITSSTMQGGSDANSEVDQFFAAYEREVQITIRGELEESFSIIREIGPGLYEIQSFFILNKMRAAMAEMAARQKLEDLSHTASFIIKEYNGEEQEGEKEDEKEN